MLQYLPINGRKILIINIRRKLDDKFNYSNSIVINYTLSLIFGDSLLKTTELNNRKQQESKRFQKWHYYPIHNLFQKSLFCVIFGIYWMDITGKLCRHTINLDTKKVQ